VGFTQAAFLALVIPLPPLSEQREIIRRLDDALARIAAAIAAHAAAITELDQLDQAVFRRAFRGQLVDQDPSDEPANALLERLAGEAAAKPDEPRKRMSHKAKSPIALEMRPILDVLHDAKASISPEDVFHQSGRDERDLEQVERFYAELRQLVIEGKVRERRPDSSTVFLSATS
jgi:hypothetical protein